MDYLKQVAGGARKAASYLHQNAGKAVDYLRQIPAVGAIMDDMAPAIHAGKKLYNAARKRSAGELPSLDEAAAGLSSLSTTRRKLQRNAY